MRPTNKRQLPMHLDKWIVTVRQGKGLTRGGQRDSFFTKLSPVCELSLDGDQGPFSTSVKPNTSQPSWDDSVEFEARQPRPLPPRARPPKGDNHSNEEKDDGELVRPPAGPKLSVVCYTRSSLTKSAMAATEIGRAEMTLAATGGGGGGGGGSSSPNKVHRIPLTRRNASGDQVAAGSVTLEYMLVPGIPRPASAKGQGAAERERGEGVPGARAAGASRRHLFFFLWGMDELRKPALPLALVGALIVAVLAVRLSGARSSAIPRLGLTPIPVPFKLPAGKYKGSSTHHVRLHDDGNIVVAVGPKPLSPPAVLAETAAGAGATATTLWQSGPLRSDPAKPGGKGTGGGGGGGGGSEGCKKCQVRVGKDGRMVLVREREELASFSPSWARAFFEVLPPLDKR